MMKSDSVRWVIPIDCIPDSKKVCLTIEEAKQANKCVMIEIANLINDFGPAELIHELEVLSASLKERIAKASKE